MYEREGGSGGCGGDPDGPNPAPRASVALTADQWSAVVMAVSHGVGAIRDSKKIPVAVINRALRDIGDATAEIARRLEMEAQSRAKRAAKE